MHDHFFCRPQGIAGAGRSRWVIVDVPSGPSASADKPTPTVHLLPGDPTLRESSQFLNLYFQPLGGPRESQGKPFQKTDPTPTCQRTL